MLSDSRWPGNLAPALVITRREIGDALRDWRIIIPTILLTIGFPALMNFTVQRMLGFADQFGGVIVAERLIPLLLMVVGFFPTSFSLVIALETFVGEKERKSLEPLLASPLSDAQLYIGKMLAALVPPVLASYLGIAVYVASLVWRIDWVIPWPLLIQVVLLTTVQAVMMVAAAVIVSSQTTSVRAANLLASFIIVPMTLLIQAEAAAMFWGDLDGLWWLILALLIATVVLVRMGVQIFNREELLGRDIDQLRLGWAWRQFWGRFSGRGADDSYPRPGRWYRQTVALLPKLRQPAVALGFALGGGIILGVLLARDYPLPGTLFDALTGEDRIENLRRLQVVTAQLPLVILFHNIRAIALAALLGIFTFGVMGVVTFALPWSLLGFLGAQLVLHGHDPWRFFLATVAPHSVFELPALVLAAAAALRWHTVVISPPPDRTVSEGWLLAAADFLRIFLGLVIPLLFLAALVEAFVTPLVLLQLYS